MIFKKHDKPMKLYALEALLRRLPARHPARHTVETDLIKEKTGLLGEKEVDFALRFLDEKQFYVMHHLRLEDDHGAFQLDSLLLTTTYALILEVKNWYGTVIFGENGQVTRIGDDGSEEGFSNPVAQAELQQHRFRKWLHQRQAPPIPIYYLVVISFPSTIIKSYSEQVPIPKQVIHANQLIHKVNELEKVPLQETYTYNKLLHLSKQLIQAHTPAKLNLLEKYRVNPAGLIKGVICPVCSNAPMIRRSHKWACHACHHMSTDAHHVALNDYYLLIDHYVTNQQMRTFLQMESPHTVKYLLKKAQLRAYGNTKSRKYELRLMPVKGQKY